MPGSSLCWCQVICGTKSLGAHREGCGPNGWLLRVQRWQPLAILFQKKLHVKKASKCALEAQQQAEEGDFLVSQVPFHPVSINVRQQQSQEEEICSAGKGEQTLAGFQGYSSTSPKTSDVKSTVAGRTTLSPLTQRTGKFVGLIHAVVPANRPQNSSYKGQGPILVGYLFESTLWGETC